MGEAEIDPGKGTLTIHASIVTYGNASSQEIGRAIANEIGDMWNEPAAIISIEKRDYELIFRIRHIHDPGIEPATVVSNTDPRLNFFRIEAYALGNISFVDGLGSNTGYFKLENLYMGSTTAAHEFGHTLGLAHPTDLDIRGLGRPGIMYPRGTWVDPPFQYDSTAEPGAPGGTMHPMHRRVNLNDIAALGLGRLPFRNGLAVIGGFTNVYHDDHALLREGE
jgi:hypothetical protein